MKKKPQISDLYEFLTLENSLIIFNGYNDFSDHSHSVNMSPYI